MKPYFQPDESDIARVDWSYYHLPMFPYKIHSYAERMQPQWRMQSQWRMVAETIDSRLCADAT